MSTRIKICGLREEAELHCCVQSGADAVGFVFYEPSKRYLHPDRAASLCQKVSAFVSTVGLFVNENEALVTGILKRVPLDLLQFHGDETAQYCEQFRRPYIKAIRVQPTTDIRDEMSKHPLAKGFILDAFVHGYGGQGHRFDWQLIPQEVRHHIILSGGLHIGNVAEAINTIRPLGVDVSSGVESVPGIKDIKKIQSFIRQVQQVDAQSL